MSFRSFSSLTIALFLFALYTCRAREKSELNHLPSYPMSYFRSLQRSLTVFNCRDKPKSRLRLPSGTVAQIPEFNSLQLSITYPNRTRLLHQHNMALNRAFFYSYILQKFNASKTDFPDTPGLLYTYLSAVADVTANPKTINSSVLMYDISMTYPNWFETFRFNTTLNLFAVRAMRVDDTFITENFLREPTLNTIRVYDLGAQMGDNYTWSSYKNAPWYGMGDNDPRFLPDDPKGQVTGAKKHIFNFDIYWEPTVKVGTAFFGPPYAGQLEGADLPVRFTQPWFDCGPNMKAFNEWVFSAVSPVVDFMPRYAHFKNLQRPRYIAVAAMDTYFLNIPVNLCPISLGNPAPNLLASSSACKPTTVCEPILRSKPVQFSSSGYSCRCAAGYRYPVFRVPEPYKGTIYRRATAAEFKEGFVCERINNLMVWPNSEGLNGRGQNATDNVKFSGRRRRDADTAATLMEIEDTTHRQRAVTKLQHRPHHRETSYPTSDQRKLRRQMKHVQAVLRNHFNVTDLEDVLQPDPDHKTVHAQARRLVSTFSKPPAAPPRRSHIQHRFNADWLLAAHENAKHAASGAPKFPKIVSRAKRAAPKPPVQINFDRDRFNRMNDIFARIDRVTGANCRTFQPSQLVLPGEVAFGAEKQFHNQASTALRLAHFLSAFLQLNRMEMVAGVRMGQRLHEHHIVGEALANVAGDVDMISSGVFFDREAFVDSKGNRRAFFGPLVYRKGSLASGSFGARDMARFPNGYHNREWFKWMKERWATNSYGLQEFDVQAYIRPSANSQTQTRHPNWPMKFRAPKLDDGYWSQPYFDCDGPSPDWLLTFAAPFFGRSVGRIKFMGVVTTSVSLRSLNVNQCPSVYYQDNYFKSTAMCDPISTYCVPIYGLGFTRGSYECHCRGGFEFPFTGPRFFFLGGLMETEYKKRKASKSNIFGILKCREASAVGFGASRMLIIFAFVLAMIRELF